MGPQQSNDAPGGLSPFLNPKAGQEPLMPPRVAPKAHPWGNDEWPQPHGDSESLEFHTPTFRRVAAKLRADLASHKQTAAMLGKAGQLGAADVGQWQAGQDLFATTKQTQASAVAVHQAFVAAYQDLIHKLEQSAKTFDTAEDETVAAIRKLEGLPGVDSTPAPAPQGRPKPQY